MSIQLAVFDLAGTTVNDPDGVNRCLRSSLHAAGLRVERDAVNALMGIAKPEAIRRLIESVPGYEHLLPRVAAIHDDFVTRMIDFYRNDPSVFEIPGTSDVFSMLNGTGIKISVNTGFFRNITQVILERMGWESRGLLQGSVTSDEVPHGRPAPDMIRHLMKQFGVTDPRFVAKIGDTPVDLQEGTNAGCGYVIGVTEGSHSYEQLEPYPHTHLIGSIVDLPATLGL